MQLLLKIAKSKFISLAQEDKGSALAITLAVFLFLFLSCASTYVVGETIQEKIELQNACDAAAYSAAAVQADGLSRMATVNKAMAWTYIQMTNRQMDYITAKWMKLSVDRFNQDKPEAQKWAKITKDPILVTNWTCNFFSSRKHRKNYDRYWWCGATNGTRDTIELNGTVYPIAIVSPFATAYDAISNLLPIYIYKDMARIEYMNLLYDDIQKSMVNPFSNDKKYNSIRETIKYTLIRNLASAQSSGNAHGKFGSNIDKILDDYYFYFKVPYGDNPYPSIINPLPPSKNPIISQSLFLPLLNRESHERIFLQMANSNGEDDYEFQKHYEFFGKDLKSASGIDQWFIRGKAKDVMGEKHGWREEDMYGLKRVYKSANMNENEAGLLRGAGGAFARGNHLISMGIPSTGFSKTITKRPGRPSRLSGRRPIWKAARNGYNGYMKTAEALTSPVTGIISSVTGAFSSQISNFIDLGQSSQNPSTCESAKDSNSLYSQYEWGAGFWICACFQVLQYKFEFHLCIPKWYCGEGTDKFLKIFQNYDTYHGYPSGSLRFDEMARHYAELAKMLVDAARGNHPAYSRENYESCEIVPNAGEVTLKGCARIYGDDKEIFNESIYLTELAGKSVVAKPWILGKSFFEGGFNGTGNGTIMVGIAKKRKNPFAKIFNAVDGIFKAFDSSSEENYMIAVSASRAAYKHPADDKENKRLYRVSYDDPTEELYAKPEGCVCKYAKENHETIKYAWNLSQTDWTAALLPVRYATSKKINTPNKSWVNIGMRDPLEAMKNAQWHSLSDSSNTKDGETIMNIKFPDKGKQLDLVNTQLIRYKVN